jgi:hypothetical protein
MSGTGVRILAADAVVTRLVAHDWRFEAERGAEIDAHWRRTQDANPKLYDGVVMLAKGVREKVAVDGGVTLEIDFFQSRFSRLIAWRDFGFPESGAYNCFSMAVLRSADGAFLLGEMGPGHSAEGAVYFPAGTPDLSDVKDGGVDLAGSVWRELAEETGFVAGPEAADPGWSVVVDGARIACLKIIRSPLDAAALKAGAERFIAAENDPELSAVHMVSRCDQLDSLRLPRFVRRFLEAELAEAGPAI